MTAQDDRLALEGLLGEEGLDQRAERIESAVRVRLDRMDAGLNLLALLGHPALAAAAVAACLIVQATLGSLDSATNPPTMEQVIGIGSGEVPVEVEVARSVPVWVSMDNDGGIR